MTDLVPGLLVQHPVYGFGVVESVMLTRALVRVRFGGAGASLTVSSSEVLGAPSAKAAATVAPPGAAARGASKAPKRPDAE